jgi:hypothetical protein
LRRHGDLCRRRRRRRSLHRQVQLDRVRRHGHLLQHRAPRSAPHSPPPRLLPRQSPAHHRRHIFQVGNAVLSSLWLSELRTGEES